MKKKHYFVKECIGCQAQLLTGLVRPMMFGFGDAENPRQDSVELVEELVIEYLTDVVRPW